MLSGIFAGLFFVFLSYFFGVGSLGERIFGSPEIFAVGASGAIFALAGLLAVLTPNLRVYVFFIIPMRMWMAIVFLLFVLWGASIGADLPIGDTAHLGGLLFGLGYAIYLKKKYKRKTKMIRQYFGS
jgi:membrane associated rhomboid family serine protease